MLKINFLTFGDYNLYTDVGELETLSGAFIPAALVLSTGNVFYGYSIGVEGCCVGEVVFNTSMTGYQEILTDPSYCNQIITFTNPHIGNVGVNDNDNESNTSYSSGIVVREYNLHSNWRAEGSLCDYLARLGLVGIAGVDTRKLTHILRNSGSQKACIATLANKRISIKKMLEMAKDFNGIEGSSFLERVSTKKPISWTQNCIELCQNKETKSKSKNKNKNIHVVVYDFGVKRQILRILVDFGCKVTVVPFDTPFKKVLELNPNGILLSNGPGDPRAFPCVIENVAELLKLEIPVLGICFGFQLIALACGGRVSKMKYGHHGANHPVQDIETNKVMITSQNHGFEVNQKHLPKALKVTHVSLFDRSLQGFAHVVAPIYGFQGHPEASPGPLDAYCFFEKFFLSMNKEAYNASKT